MKLIIIIMITLSFISCSTVHQTLDPAVYYKRTMKIKHNSKTSNGVFVLPYKEPKRLNKKVIGGPDYDIEFQSAGKLNLFTFTTCHREMTQENAKSKGIFGNKQKFGLTYTPDIEIEALFACPIQVAGYDMKGKHSFGFMEMETKDATLPADVKCNGEVWKSNGVTICQTKEGLEQSIHFENKVVWVPEAATRPECKNIKHRFVSQRRLFYNTPNRECVFMFKEINGGRSHRLYTIGYEEILIREI